MVWVLGFLIVIVIIISGMCLNLLRASRSAAELLREDLATDFHPNQGFSSDVEHSSKKENGVRKPYKNKHGFSCG